MFTSTPTRRKIESAEGIGPEAFSTDLESTMNAKEVKAALNNEAVQAAIQKEVAKAVKAETKRCLGIVKNTGLPEGKAEAKAVKAFAKEVAARIK